MKKFQQQRISRQGRSVATPANCFSTYLMRRRLSTFCNLATYRKKIEKRKGNENQEAAGNRCQQSAKPTTAALRKTTVTLVKHTNCI